MFVLAFAAAMYLLASGVGSLIARGLLGPHGDVVGESARDVWNGLVDGFRHLRDRPAARDAILVVTGHRVAFGASTVLALLLLRNTLNSPADPTGALGGFTKVVAVAATGALIAALLTPWATRRIGSAPWIVGTLLGAAIIGAIGLLGMTLDWPVLAGMTGLFLAALGIGFSGQAVKVTSDTIVQKAVSDDHRGRVFSLYDVAVNIGLVIGVVWIAFTAPTSGVSIALDFAIPAVLATSAICYAIASRRRGPIA
jgi:MFS family permease